MDSFKDSHILITGGTGSFGKALVQNLVFNEKFTGKITIFSRDEFKQYKMSLEYPDKLYPNIRFVLGDIRDRSKLIEATRTVDYIIHAAALKHVSISETNVMEYVKTNIIGSDNVLEAARVNKVKKLIGISTDKVVAPNNVYGITKLCAEKIFLSDINSESSELPGLSIIRFGNFIGSRGSILPYLLKNRTQDSITLNDGEMTRFYTDIDETSEAVLFALKNGGMGEVIIPKSRSIKLSDLAETVLPETRIHYSKPGKGEKMHEDLIFPEETAYLYEIDKYYIIQRNPLIPLYFKRFNAQKVREKINFSSNNKDLLLKKADLVQFIHNQITKLEQ